ncbi:MAG TPA: hypothetical protein VG898_03850 [Solirubrobacterales bacterium]|nr:hypothetical protein [Solirubrobacterales bacterium]
MAEGCERCGAPLADDQHYCLECGQRTGSPRVDYRHYMAPATVADGQAGERPAQPTDPSQTPAAEEPAKAQRDYAPLAAVGGIAVLGLMLLIGVLIGKGNNDTATAPAPQIVRVPGGGEEEASEEGSGSKKSAEGLGAGGSGSKKAKQGGGSGGTGKATKASEGDLEQLGSTSGEDYVKQSENLPNEIATPGAPPPIDKSKPPGGGEGGAEVIK